MRPRINDAETPEEDPVVKARAPQRPGGSDKVVRNLEVAPPQEPPDRIDPNPIDPAL